MSTLVSEKINSELLRLQEELGTLDNAVKQISKAEKLSTETVDAIRNMQTEFAKSLNILLVSINEYLAENQNFTEGQIKNLSESHLRQIQKSDELFGEYTRFVLTTEKRNNEYVEKVVQQYTDFLQKAYDNTEHKLSGLVAALSASNVQVQKMLAHYNNVTGSASNLISAIENVGVVAQLNDIMTQTMAITQEVINSQERIKESEVRMTEIIKKQEVKIQDQQGKLNTITVLMFIVLLMSAASLALRFVK